MSPHRNPPKLDIQPSDATWKENVNQLQMNIKLCQALIDKAKPGEEITASVIEKMVLEALFSQYQTIRDPKNRVIGHVLFSNLLVTVGTQTQLGKMDSIGSWIRIEMYFSMI
ncbi:hypothetical protein HYE68_003868 [Fusarium pseudograminearum]|nr:hypothetical protein HYE68_003868 [Fusarium pseudograminearum]